MKIHYLEVVTHDVNSVCNAYEALYNVAFGDPEKLLGGARTCALPDGSTIGVRGPLSDHEGSLVRPYWLVENIESAIDDMKSKGAEIAMAPTEIAGKGVFAIVILGGIEQGLWQL